MRGDLRVEECASFGQLRAVATDLAHAAPADDPFLSLAWFEVLAAHGFDPQARLRIMVVRDPGGAAQLVLPLVGGASVTALSNYYSCLYGPVAGTPPPDPAALDALCRHLKTGAAPAREVRLAPLAAQGSFTGLMLDALRRAGFWADTYFCFGNWTLEVGGRCYDAYARSLPGPLRTTLQRRRRQLERQGRCEIAIHRVPGAALEAVIAAFEAVYRASWKTPEPFPRFLPELCRVAAALGWLRLGVLALDGKALAAQVWLHCAGRSLIYKLAYDAGFAHLSPGTILTAAMMRQAIDVDHATEVDYLSGDDAYKRDWMSHRRERIGIVAFNPLSLRGLAGAARHYGGRAWAGLRAPGAAPAPLG